jgi:sterol desaturase/sphingolipid hydroxylase (fatty acid hydroxylase superfamily)
MTPRDNLTLASNATSLLKRVLVGGGIALALITAFILAEKNPDPSWGKFWMVRPLIITPLAGAAGGLSFYLIHRIFHQYGWNRIMAFILSIFVYLVALWMGIVLGLDGTLWD